MSKFCSTSSGFFPRNRMGKCWFFTVNLEIVLLKSCLIAPCVIQFLLAWKFVRYLSLHCRNFCRTEEQNVMVISKVIETPVSFSKFSVNLMYFNDCWQHLQIVGDTNAKRNCTAKGSIINHCFQPSLELFPY